VGVIDRSSRGATPIVIPIGVFLLLIANAIGDHYFRDEFYYLACSRRLAWGYVDHPPLSIGLLWIIRGLFGESLIVLRLAAATVAAVSVWLTGRIARRLGASTFGHGVAMIAMAVAPELLATASFYSMNVFDVLFWTLAAAAFVDVLERPSLGRWAILGTVIGLGLENKLSVLWLAAGIGAGLILTRARRLLLTPGPWVAAAIAAVMLMPHVLWQVANGWPTLEFISNASRDKMQVNTPVQFLTAQILNMHPLTLPVWTAGLLFLLFSQRANRFRPLGIAFLTVAFILIVNRTSRAGYLAPAYPFLFAAGGVVIDEAVRRSIWRVAIVTGLILAGSVTAPLTLPLLPVDNYVRYSARLGVAPDTEEKKELGRLPQFFADRQGWEAFVNQVAAAFERLTPAERATATTLVGNYGEAGAIERLGRARGLTAISGHNNYWLWGPGDRSGDVVIVLSRSRERLLQRFASVELDGEIDCGDCMPYENHLPIFICRGPKVPLQTLWPSLKHFD
jgi:hypothetical protein